MWPAAVAVAHFLALTRWRSGEALGLRRSEIDLIRRVAHLGDTKTGRSSRPLSKAACEVLKSQEGSTDLVFPPSKGKGQMTGFRKFWQRIAAKGDLVADVTPHVLRHSFASLANDLGHPAEQAGDLIRRADWRGLLTEYIPIL
jgi:integrase